MVAALGGDGRFVVHTEFVLTDNGRAVVLETAARAPGALVSDIAAIRTGVHLEKVNLRLQAGLPVPAVHDREHYAGWLWFPAAREAPGEARRPTLLSEHRLQLLPGALPAATLLVWSRSLERVIGDLTRLREDPVVG